LCATTTAAAFPFLAAIHRVADGVAQLSLQTGTRLPIPSPLKLYTPQTIDGKRMNSKRAAMTMIAIIG
jgi:hypothetical protein